MGNFDIGWKYALRRVTYSVALPAVLLASTAQASSIEQDFLFGANQHLGMGVAHGYKPEETLSMVKGMGFNAYREDVSWRVSDAVDYAGVAVQNDRLYAALTQEQSQPVLVMGSGPPLIERGLPVTEEDRVLFARHAGQVATLLRAAHPIYEIWNEWNLGSWNINRVHGKPEDYVALTRGATPEIKNADPQATVLVGAVGDDAHWAWTKAAVKAGLLQTGDALSVHIYNHCQPKATRNAEDMLWRLNDLHQAVLQDAKGGETNIYLTEFGWPTVDDKCGGVPESDVADNFARLLVGATAIPWLKGIWIYELKDEGTNDPDREMHFGIFQNDNREKPAACEIRETWTFIRKFQRPKETHPTKDLAAYIFSDGGPVRHLIAWASPSSPSDRSITLPQGARTMIPCGESETVRETSHEYALKTKPILVEIDEKDLQKVVYR
jgi:hypothetical protein